MSKGHLEFVEIPLERDFQVGNKEGDGERKDTVMAKALV